MPNKELQLYSCEYVMDTALKKTPFIVDRLLAPGLYILAGAPKVGKSWLVLDLCLSVSEGRDFLGHRTTKGQVVYLALEDSLIRLQNRVYEFTDEPTENLDFALLANTIGNGLENQLEAVKEQNGEIMNPQTPTKQFDKFLKKHGLKHRKLHSLRHTSATLLLYGGINIRQVQQRLGHSELETTQKYLHYLSEADVEAVNVLTNMLEPKKDKVIDITA